MIRVGSASVVQPPPSSVHLAPLRLAVSVDDIGSPATASLDLPPPPRRHHFAHTRSSVSSYAGVHPTSFVGLPPHNRPECWSSSKQWQGPSWSGGVAAGAAAAPKAVVAGALAE